MNIEEDKRKVIGNGIWKWQLYRSILKEMILADECLIRGTNQEAAVYSHITKVIDEALRELDEPEE